MSRPVVRSLAALATVVAIFSSSAQAQQRAATITRVTAAIRPEAVWAPLRFLSDDLLEGRGTGARGGELAVQYIAAEFMALGLEPAGDSGTFFQRVPIVAQNPTATMEYTAGGASHPLRFRDDFVAWSEQIPAPSPSEHPGEPQRGTVDAANQVVFVGFGIAAPEYRWDDYKGTDVAGKILLMLVNDPGLRDSTLFRGREHVLTYYGRWTYKLEEAARRGAVGPRGGADGHPQGHLHGAGSVVAAGSRPIHPGRGRPDRRRDPASVRPPSRGPVGDGLPGGQVDDLRQPGKAQSQDLAGELD